MGLDERAARLNDQRNRAKANAYQAAYRRLREVHRTEFDTYYADERRKAGLA